jgi:hypothetical protein
MVFGLFGLSGNTITHIMKVEMWCFIIVLHWYCGLHKWIFNESHIHIGHIIFWNMLWNVNHKALSKLDDVSARSLGLVDAIPLQLQLISTIIKLKLVFLVEAAFSCLQIPIISKNVNVKYVDSKLPNLHTKMVIESRILGFHPIYIYIVHNLLTWPNTHLQSIRNIFFHNNNNWRRKHVWAKKN